MKKLFSILFIIIVLTFSACLIASANSVTLINKGEPIELINTIIERNNDYYISLDDLKSINLDYYQEDDNVYSLGQLNGPLKYTFYLDSGVLEYETFYRNAVLTEENTIYLSLSVLSDIYSYPEQTYIDTSCDVVSMWINDYTTETYWVIYQIDSSIPIPDEGLEATLYRGFKRFGGVGVAFDGARPESFEGVDTTYIPNDSDVYNMDSLHLIKTYEYHIFNDCREFVIHYDKAVRRSYGVSGDSFSSLLASGGSGSSGSGGGVSINGWDTAGIKIDNDTYIGGTYEKISKRITTVLLTIDDCMEYITVSGTITVPFHSEDLYYMIIAEANNRSILNENGVYETSRDFVNSQKGTISANETAVDYILKVKPNQDYVVYIRFNNGEYVRKYVTYDDLVEDKVYDFKDFVVSKEITGKIKLPSDITTLTDCYNNSLGSVHAYITLQGGAAPYYKVQEAKAELTLEDGYADFVLKDDIGIENGLVSFRIYGGVKEIYGSGVYYDDTTIKYVAEDGTVIPTDTKNIIINVTKGKIIEVDVNCAVNSCIDVSLLVVRNEAESTGTGCPIFVNGYETDKLYENENYAYTLKNIVIVPEDSTQYIPYLHDPDSPYDRLFLTYENEWVPETDLPCLITSEQFTTVYEGYDPPIPIEIIYCGNSSDNVHVYDYYVDSLFDYEATIYVAYYGKNNKLLHIDSREQTFVSQQTYELYYALDSKYEPLAETIKMFVCTNALRPLSAVTLIKSTE